MEKDFEYFIRQANRNIQMCEERGHNELKEYVASLLYHNDELEEKYKQLEEKYNYFQYGDFYQILDKHPEYEDFVFKIKELKQKIRDNKDEDENQLRLKESEIQYWKNYCFSLKKRNKKLKEEICAWKQVIDWAIECDFSLEQIIQDENELDNFIEEMDKKGIDYLDMFNEYAKKYIKER